MIADGVIADSLVSFRITWQKPSKGESIKWDQNDQHIELHSVDLYPDLKYTKANATATYLNYSSADAIIKLLTQIDQMIDKKISGSSGDSSNKSNGDNLEADQSESGESKKEPAKTSDHSYTVTVYGEKLRLLDAQEKTGIIQINHRVSDNLLRKVGDIEVDNTSKIWAEVKMSGLLSSTHTFTASDFDVDQAEGPIKRVNLLVQVLPSIQLNFTPSQESIIPRSQQDEYLKRFSNDDSRIGRLVSKLRGENTELKQKLIKAGISLTDKSKQKQKGS